MNLQQSVFGVVSQLSELPMDIIVGCAVMIIESDEGIMLVSNVGANDAEVPSHSEVKRVLVSVLMEAVNKLTASGIELEVDRE